MAWQSAKILADTVASLIGWASIGRLARLGNATGGIKAAFVFAHNSAWRARSKAMVAF
jgi:hypothetical protein